MLKKQFLSELQCALEGLPENEIKERISFYSDMIDDRMEDGMSEEDAVKDIGTVEEIKSQIMSDVSLVKIVKHKMKPKRRLKTWEIVVMCVTSPIWVALMIAFFAIILALVVSMWAVAFAFFTADFSIGIGGMGGAILAMVEQFAEGFITNGVVCFGCGLAALGISFLILPACIALVKGVVKFIKFIVLRIKYGLVGGTKNE